MTLRQLTLFGAEPRRLPSEEGSSGLEEPPAGSAANPSTDDLQIELFAQPVVLARELEAALAAGRFEEAACLRVVLEAAGGPSVHTGRLGFLERLGRLRWKDSPGEALSVWAEIDGRLGERAHLRAPLRAGVFARLLALHTPETLVETRPECLPALTAVLVSRPEISPGAGRWRARGLVRDALLAGRDLVSLDFGEDEPLADLLAEDYPPCWLACLGLIRRLWPAPPPDESDRASLRNTYAQVRPSEEAALEFWRYLRVAESADTPEELLHEARRRMKGLSPELHALYMRRANGSRGS